MQHWALVSIWSMFTLRLDFLLKPDITTGSSAKVSYFWVLQTILSLIPYDLLPEDKNNLEIFKNWAWVLWLTTLTARPWLICGIFFIFDLNFFIAKVFAANYICKVHCSSIRWDQSLFTVHKLSRNERKISSRDSNLGKLDEKRKRYLCAVPGPKCSTKVNFGQICATPQENEPRSNKCFFLFFPIDRSEPQSQHWWVGHFGIFHEKIIHLPIHKHCLHFFLC